jgi:hypothetical protein
MTKPESPQKRQANKRNALRSTGDYLDWEQFNKRPIPDKDLKFILNSKLKMQKLWLSMHKRTQRDKLKRAANSLRYLKRSSNQLIKTLKALRSS